ncbi:hypothetical protein C8J56DRAFT_910200 [Mycena floridula]|nr:hypothetical protein C8J56DRAFT_910200 [Mycena floridula]
MSSIPSKILLLTLSELGQANSILAILSELLTRDGLEVHIASFPVLEKQVNKVVSQSNNAISTVTFHPLSGPTYAESVSKKAGVAFGEFWVHPPTWSDFSAVPKMAMAIHAFSEEDHISQMQEMSEIISQVDPDITVVDVMFNSAHDACRALKRRRIVNVPTQSLDFLLSTQSGWLWRYPPLASDLCYPLSWKDTFKSIYVTLRRISLLFSTTEAKEMSMMRKKHNLSEYPDIVSGYTKEVDYLNPSLDCTDFPFICPANVYRCGPLVLDTIPIVEADPELAQWLSKAPTIFICLGSHHQYTETDVRGILGGLLTDLPAQTQVLWKLRGSFESLIEEMFLKHGTKPGDRFRILDWIGPDPASVLQHPNVLCSVHHGGANSFFEACYSGKPQIILAKWMDLYSNAVKIEYHHLGIYGNRNAAPDVEAVEFGKAVSRIMGDSKEALEFRASASRVSQLCWEAGGRKTAVDHVLEIMTKNGKETA